MNDNVQQQEGAGGVDLESMSDEALLKLVERLRGLGALSNLTPGSETTPVGLQQQEQGREAALGGGLVRDEAHQQRAGTPMGGVSRHGIGTGGPSLTRTVTRGGTFGTRMRSYQLAPQREEDGAGSEFSASRSGVVLPGGLKRVKVDLKAPKFDGKDFFNYKTGM